VNDHPLLEQEIAGIDSGGKQPSRISPEVDHQTVNNSRRLDGIQSRRNLRDRPLTEGSDPQVADSDLILE